jgi:hypothetical protein
MGAVGQDFDLFWVQPPFVLAGATRSFRKVILSTTLSLSPSMSVKTLDEGVHESL